MAQSTGIGGLLASSSLTARIAIVAKCETLPKARSSQFASDLGTGQGLTSSIQSHSFPTFSAVACPSRIRCQAATGSWTRSRQWETQRTLFSSARATVCPPAKVNGVWPSNDAWLRAAL